MILYLGSLVKKSLKDTDDDSMRMLCVEPYDF